MLRAGQTVTETELIDHARATLAPFKLPKAIHFVDELPRNQSGKLLKRVLRDDLAAAARHVLTERVGQPGRTAYAR